MSGLTCILSTTLVFSRKIEPEDIQRELYKNLIRLVKREFYSINKNLQDLYHDLHVGGVDRLIEALNAKFDIRETQSAPPNFLSFLKFLGFNDEEVTQDTVRAALEWYKNLSATQLHQVNPCLQSRF